MTEPMTIYTVLTIDRHCDPFVELYSKEAAAIQEAYAKAGKYWRSYRRVFPNDSEKSQGEILRLIQEGVRCHRDVGTITVRRQEVTE